MRHEYALLLKEQFGNLDEASQMQILGWIEEGPDDLEDRIEYWTREGGAAPEVAPVGWTV